MAAGGRAWWLGIRTVVRAPLLVIAVLGLLAVLVAPWAVVLAAAWPEATEFTDFTDADRRVFRLEDWSIVRDRLGMLGATLVPTLLGVSGAMQNLAGFADGHAPAPPVWLTLVVGAPLWIGVWALVSAAAANPAAGLTACARQVVRSAGPLAGLAILIAATLVLTLVALHPVVVGRLLPAMTTAFDERTAFLVRLAAYVVVWAPLTAVVVVADYARAAVVATGAPLAAALRQARAFVRTHAAAVVGVMILHGLSLAAVFALYGVFEVLSRGVPRAWSAILVGQAYVIGRVLIRMVALAAHVHLMKPSWLRR